MMQPQSVSRTGRYPPPHGISAGEGGRRPPDPGLDPGPGAAAWGMARCLDAGWVAQASGRTSIDTSLLSTPHPALRATFPGKVAEGKRSTSHSLSGLGEQWAQILIAPA